MMKTPRKFPSRWFMIYFLPAFISTVCALGVNVYNIHNTILYRKVDILNFICASVISLLTYYLIIECKEKEKTFKS